MSKQFNYYAMGEDENFICRTLINVLGEILICSERGTMEQMTPRPVNRYEDLLSTNVKRKLVIIPSKFSSSIEYRPIPENKYRIDFNLNPVVEYIPSGLISPDTVKVGRIAYFYGEEEFLSPKISELFTVLKKGAKRMPHSSGFWIFDKATVGAKMLQDWGGSLERNPMVIEED